MPSVIAGFNESQWAAESTSIVAVIPGILMGRTPNRFDVKVRVAFVALFFVLLPPLGAQDCTLCTLPDDTHAPIPNGGWSLSKQVNEVNVIFVAVQHGKFVDNLTGEDISVWDDNKRPEAILAFRAERELSLRVGIVIDTSDSVISRFAFEQSSASQFLRHVLTSEHDRMFVLGFSDHVRLAQDFTSNADLLSEAVKRLTIGGGTALYDAISAGCEKLRQQPGEIPAARVLVVLSDGQNNAGKLTLEAAVDAAQQAEVTIYAISTRYPRLPDYNFDFAGQAGNANLRRLAEQTGGRVLFPNQPRNLPDAFALIDQELRNRYAVSYRPAEFKPDGHYRKITIEAHKAGARLRVRARKGYHARFTLLPALDVEQKEHNQQHPSPEPIQPLSQVRKIGFSGFDRIP